jgi:anti-sigma B factor antagonist
VEFKVQHLDEKVAVAIVGELDAITAPEVRGLIDAIVEAKPERVEVDLSSLDLIDSAGIGAIVSFFKRTREYGGRFTVFGLKGQPRSIFAVLRLDRVFVAPGSS